MEETLEQQAIRDKREALERERLAERDECAPRRRRGWIGFLSALLGAAGGLVLGGFVGGALAPPPDPNAFMDLSVVDWVVDGAIIGFFSGLLVGLTVWWATAEVWKWWRRYQ